MKKSSLALSVLLAFSSLSYADRYEMRAIKIEMAQWQPLAPEFSDWRVTSEPYNCHQWSPSVSTVNGGSSFIQQRKCSQDRVGNKYQEEIDVISKETRILFDGEITSTIEIIENQEATGEKDHIIGQSYDDWNEWSGNSESDIYDCTEWIPVASSIPIGTKFNQTRDCKITETRERDVFDDYYSGVRVFKELETETRESDYQDQQESTGTALVRDMCVDKLQRGQSTDGVYTVDPDGIGPLPAKSAYCLMSQGGWTLYDSFGLRVGDVGSSPSAYNYRNINSTSALSSAGYSYDLTTINSSSYYRNNTYMQWFYGGDHAGSLQKNMPSWVNQIRIDASGAWYENSNRYQFGSSTYTSGNRHSRIEKVLNGSGRLKLSEGVYSGAGIMWLDAIWVK